MKDMVRVALDAMGGDNAPAEIVKGAIEAVNEKEQIQVLLVGKEEEIQKELKKYSYSEEQIKVVKADEVITNDEAPVMAIRRKKDSSIVVALNLIKAGEADAFVSAGSTEQMVQPKNFGFESVYSFFYKRIEN